MATIADIRKQYPQYGDLSDKELADGLYKKFYSDMPREEFDKKLGLDPREEAKDALRTGLKDEPAMTAQRGEADYTARKARGAEYGLTDYAAAQIPFGDEAAAAGRAVGRLVGGLVRGESVDLADEYAVGRAAEEAAAADYAADNPKLAALGKTAAVLASAGSAAPVAIAPTIIGRTAQSAGTGAAFGALEGASEGEGLQERAINAATGAGIGALGGAVATPLVEGLVSGAGAIKRLVSPMAGGAAREAEAARRVVSSLGGDEAALRAANVMQDASGAGIPMIVGDTGDAATRSLMRSARNTSSEADAALQTAIQPRFDEQGERVQRVLRDITGAKADTAALQERVQSVARTTNKAAYNRAYKEGEAGAWDDELSALAQAPSVQNAIRKATRTGANKAAIEGAEVPRNPFLFQEGKMTLREGMTPTLRFWDAVKRNLDDEIGGLQRAGAKSAAADTLALKSRIVEKMDEMFPSYREARRGAAAFFDAEDAVEAGSKFVNSGMENAAGRRAFEQMSKPEQDLFRESYVNEKMRQVAAMGDNRNVTSSSKLFNSQQARERDEIVLGKVGARRVQALAQIENVMNLTKQAIQGNSSTAKQLLEAGLAGGVSGGVGGLLSGGDLSNVSYMAAAGSILGPLMRRGYNLVDQKTAEKVGRMLASNDPETLRKAVRMISVNPRLQEGLQRLEANLGRLLAPALAGSATEAPAQ